MKINHQLMIGFTIVTVFVAIIGIFSIYSFIRIQENNYFEDDVTKYLQGINDLRWDILKFSKITTLDESDRAKNEFENQRKVLESSNNTRLHKGFLDTYHLQEDINDFNLLSDEIIKIHREKLIQQDIFDRNYKIEKDQRYNIRVPLFALNNSKLTEDVGFIQYYSKETLYQHEDQATLNDWLKSIDKVSNKIMKLDIPKENKSYLLGELNSYNQTAQIMGKIVIRLKEIEIEEQKKLKKMEEIINKLEIAQHDAESVVHDESKKISDYSSKLLIFIILFISLSTMVVGYTITNKVSKPLTSLRDTTIEIGKGNLDIDIEVSSKDEIGQLAMAFKKMTDDLKQTTVSKNYVNNIIENMFGSLIVTNTEGIIRTVNKATCDMLGYQEKEIIGQSSDIILQKENGSSEIPYFYEIIEREFISNIEIKYKAKNGSTIPMLFSSSILRKESGEVEGLVCVAQELTERKKTEDKIMRNALQQVGIAKLGLSALSETDVSVVMDDAVKLINKTLNMEFCKVLKILPDEETLLLIAGTGWKEGHVGHTILYAGGDSQAGYSLLSNNPVIMKDLGSETRFIPAPLLRDHGVVSGISVIIQGKERPYGVLGAHTTRRREFTEDEVSFLQSIANVLAEAVERRKAEEALERVLKDWQNTFDAISDGVWILDSDGCILRSNGVFEKMLGIETKNIIGKYCYEIAHGCNTHIEDCPCNIMLKTGKRASLELEVREKGVHLYITVDPIYDDSGNLINIVHIVRNVTELRKAEDIRLENVQLSHASKAKSDFLANMSHELRTPLNSILGFTQIMREGNPENLNEKHRHYLDNVISSGNHLLKLINEILDLSKIESGKIEIAREKIDIHKIIEESIIMIKEKAEANNIFLRTEFDIQIDSINADKLKIKQILFNLLSNAMKFSKKEGGTVTIRTKKEENIAKISISDTGIGIKNEDMHKLFKEFTQLDAGYSRAYGGTGLGLTISKKLVELHGGKISVDSVFGEGTTFTISMPLADN